MKVVEVCQLNDSLLRLFQTYLMLIYNFLHIVGIVTIGEEKKICTASENFLRMCESTEVSILALYFCQNLTTHFDI
jgi:hypothetical protein